MQVIYKIYWNNEESIYIGKTKSLKARIHQHIHSLKNNSHYNYKLQDMYNKYGEFSHEILEVCEDIEIFAKEVYWIRKLNTVEKGLNLIGSGINTNKDIIDSAYMPPIVSDKIECKVILLDKNDNIFYVNNISEFCRTQPDLRDNWKTSADHLCAIIREDCNGIHKGYRKYNGVNTPPPPSITSFSVTFPDGRIVHNILNLAKFCRETPELVETWENAADGLRRVARGVTIQYKGFKCKKAHI